MRHLGDFDLSTVIYGKFTTASAAGAPITLAGTPALSVYKNNSTTQSTSGVTLTVDFDSVTGLQHFAIDTSSDGTFYAAGGFFDIVITTGTVDGVSVVGHVVASFTLRATSALKPTTAGRTLDVSATGEAGLDWANIGSPTTTVGLSGTTVKTATDVETDTADIQSRLPAALVSGRIDASVGAMANNVMTAAAAAADLTTELQNGLATAANLATVAGYLDTEIAAILAVAIKLDDTLEDDAGTYRFTTNALEQAPAGGGGGGTDWTADERTAIRTILGIPGSGTTPAAPSAGALATLQTNVTALPAAVWAVTMEGSRTAIQYMRGFGATLLGKASGMGTGTGIFRDVDDTKNRVTATQDADGNRTAITLDLT